MKKYFLFLSLLIVSSLLSFYKTSLANTNQWNIINPTGTSGYSFNTISAIGNYVYLGTNHGVYKSIDGGTTWIQMNSGLTNLNITSIAIGWFYNSNTNSYATTSSSFVFIGTSGGGVFVSTIDGSSWIATSTGLTDKNILDLKIDQFQATQGNFTNIYAATPNGIFISTSTGSYWKLDNSGLSGQPTKIITAYNNAKIYALTNSNKLYSSDLFSSSGIYESWSQVFDANGTTTNDISIINAVGDIGWLSTNKGIYKSNGTGLKWASTNIGLSNDTVKNVASDYIDSNIAYASIYGSGVYRTTNEADEAAFNVNPQIPEWLPINQNLSDLNIIEVKTDPYDSKNIYAISTNGVYKLIYSSTPIEYIDLTPPSDITDLTVNAIDSSHATLFWTAPGNNNTYGTSTSYDLRYSTSSITIDNFSAATAVVPEPTPWGYGHATSYDVFNLTSGYKYYFAIKTLDSSLNSSNISNIASLSINIPTVSTQNSTFISQNGATFNGTLLTNSNASTTVRGFTYGTTAAYSETLTNNGDFSPGPYSTVMSDIFTCGTTYHYAAYAMNISGIAHGDDTLFTTLPCSDTTPPTVTSFTIPTSTYSGWNISIPISSFTAEDNITDYIITTYPQKPSSFDPNWSETAPKDYTVKTPVRTILYPWVKDSSGKISDLYQGVEVIVEDPNLPLNAPYNLVATPISSNQINLSWSNNNNKSSFIRYMVYRNGMSVATVDSTTYSDINLSPSTTYRYTIIASNGFTTISEQQSPVIDVTTLSLPIVGSTGSGGGGGGGGGSNTAFFTLTTTREGTGQGTITSIPVGVSCGSQCLSSFLANSTIILNALPRSDSHLASWTGCSSFTSTTCTVIMSASKTILANFSTGTTTSIIKNYPTTTNTQSSSSISSGGANITTLSYPYYTSVFTIGTKGATVIDLQKYLNIQGFTKKQYITGYYGQITATALEEYKKYIATKISMTSPYPTDTDKTKYPLFTRSLANGSKGQDVVTLQKFLNSNGFIISKSGPGSPGNESEYFGLATKSALILFQNKYTSQILAPLGLKVGTGFFGIGTINLVNSLISN